ncbi:MAG: dihydrodipicolinate synthase family protein [Gammaproteobacteria bacterium]
MALENLKLTRRQYLTATTLTALSSMNKLFAQPGNPMRGALMILSTPYTAVGQVDYESLAHQVAFLDTCGVQGLVWPQNSSEQRYLSTAERMRGFEVLTEANRGRNMVLVLGVQADDTAGMLEYARFAEALAPDGMIAIPPTDATTLDDIYRYYQLLCEVTSRPVFVQTSGGPDLELSVDFLVRLATDFPNCAYIKEEYGNVQQRIIEEVKHRPNPIKSVITASFGRSWLYEMRLGVDGVMTGGAMYGDIYARLWELQQSGQQEQLRDCFSRLLLMLNLDSTIPGVRLYVLQRRGIFKTTLSRRGEYRFAPHQVEEIEYRLASLQPYLKIPIPG